MKKITTIILLVAMLAMPATGFAASPWTEEATYGGKVTGKIQFGLQNVLFGWADIFVEPIRAYNKCSNCNNVWAGMGKGLIEGFVNEVGGVLQLLTFPVPVDIPLPGDGIQFAVNCDRDSN